MTPEENYAARHRRDARRPSRGERNGWGWQRRTTSDARGTERDAALNEIQIALQAAIGSSLLRARLAILRTQDEAVRVRRGAGRYGTPTVFSEPNPKWVGASD